MKQFKTILLSSALILSLSACGGDDKPVTVVDQSKNIQTAQKSMLKGQTTLAQARVCVDENSNLRCDEDEVQIETSPEGTYTLEVDHSIENGTKLLVEDGYNLILEESNLQRFRFTNFYNAESSEHNINAITSLLQSNSKEAKESLADALNLDITTLLEDPIALASTDNRLFLSTHGIEDGYRNRAIKQSSSSSKSPQRAEKADLYITPSLDDSLSFLADGTFLNYNVADYLLRIELKIKDFFYDISNLISSQFGGEKLSTNVSRENLNGVWLSYDAKKTDSCVVINAQDRMITHRVESSEELSIYFSESSSSLSVLMGWNIVAELKITDIDYDTLRIKNEKTDLEATEYKFVRYESLEACKVELSKEDEEEEKEVTIPHLSSLKGKIKINLAEGFEYKNLKINYRTKYGNTSFVTADENGSFHILSTNERSDILIIKGNDSVSLTDANSVYPDTLVLLLQMNIYNDSYKGYRKTTIKQVIEVTDAQQDGNITSFDLGKLELSVAEVNVCVNNYDYETDGSITYMNDLGSSNSDTGNINFFVALDNKEHFITLVTDPQGSANYALIPYMATAETLDMRDSCVDLTTGETPNITFTIENEFDNNASEVVLTPLFGEKLPLVSREVDESKTVVTSTYNVSLKGYYYLKVMNYTNNKTYLIDKEVTVSLFGKSYRIKPEFFAIDSAGVASIIIFNKQLVILASEDDKLLKAIENIQ